MSHTGTKIHKPNIFYKLLKAYQLLVFHLFYGKVEVIGRENIPYSSPIIFTPNHQNALMDALIVLDTAGINPVFMARADIFKKKILNKILTFLKMLPVYRQRDGVDELSKNDKTFLTCLDILRDCYSVCLMPEGNHGDKRRLRTLVKGTFRIAFRAQEEFGHLSPIKIVPVGIDFEHYYKIQQNLLVVYGKPIEVAEYMQDYTENPAKTMNAIKDKLAEELRKLIIHIENVDHYDMFQDLRSIYNSRMRRRMGISGRSGYDRFRADKQMISILDQEFIVQQDAMVILSGKVSEYMKGLRTLHLRNWVIDRKGYSITGIIFRTLALIIGFPVFVFGAVSNLIPYIIPVKATRNVKDTQFISSFKFGVALVVFLLYYILVGVISGLLTGPAWFPWALMFSMVISGYIALFYSFLFKKLYAALRFRFFNFKRDKRIKAILDLHEEIVSELNTITEKYMKSVMKDQKEFL